MLVRMYNEVGLLFRQISKKQGPFVTIDLDLILVIEVRIKTFNKYYSSLREYNLYYIVTLMDPRIKTK